MLRDDLAAFLGALGHLTAFPADGLAEDAGTEPAITVLLPYGEVVYQSVLGSRVPYRELVTGTGLGKAVASQ